MVIRDIHDCSRYARALGRVALFIPVSSLIRIIYTRAYTAHTSIYILYDAYLPTACISILLFFSRPTLYTLAPCLMSALSPSCAQTHICIRITAHTCSARIFPSNFSARSICARVPREKLLSRKREAARRAESRKIAIKRSLYGATFLPCLRALANHPSRNN